MIICTVSFRLVEMYHSASPDSVKEGVLQQFPGPDSQIRVLISTVAFGMGVNIPDVRLVVNWGIPSSVLEYWQQVK